ncbi:polysaccharide deacetylase family protein [Salinimicrobium sp. MT39]|uniref:Polysaccharide deacetylase family protein n=1 Tax=Salinimicrobium profundisediminis TaxID=2994553 RepID=A0A9X3CXW4_9FLAO|nr:polysaccharide deacetylase family protein [Salinimicrobium profundisediminis]MCX2837480.1 polysaccharide deacetylase family protein [Salinimicrobium profundisediminis]
MLIVANYHYIREDFSAPYPSIFGLTPQQFRSQLEQLSRFGNFISQEDLLYHPKRAFDKNFFLITFDDGLKEQYDLAQPVLEEMGIPHVFFINTFNFSDNKVSLVHKIHLLRSQIPPLELLQELEVNPLSEIEEKAALKHYNYDSKENALLKYLLNFKLSHEEQKNFVEPLFAEVFEEEKIAKELYFTEEMLQELHKKRALGSHSHRHLPLGRLKASEVKNEMHKTQDFFLKRFGKKAISLSYPYGSRDSCVGIQKMVKEAGFELGFSMERAANASLEEDSLLLARYDCNDLPGGKNDLFENKNPFEKTAFRQWHTYENSLTHKR